MERKISNIYAEAQGDISVKWDDFMKSHYPKLKDAHKKLKEAEATGDTEEIKKAKDLYERTAMNITVNNRRYQSMLNDVTNKLAHTNQIALDYINGNMASIYTTNYNAFGDEKVKGYSFAVVNEAAVKELATTDKTLLPKKKLDISKDKRWNAKNINSQVLQGILQGESIDKIAKRLTHVTDMNRNSSVRNARTMVTSAENKGRQDSFKKAQSDGVIMTRTWVAAHDSHTRAWHSDLHGVEVGVDEPWENDYGKIMYPGDPSADPANVYNCRCSIRAHVKGFDWNKRTKNELTFEEKGEILSYKSSDYYNINYVLRTLGFRALSELEKQKVKNLDSALKKLPRYSGDVSRSLDFFNEDDMNDFIERIENNKEQTFAEFLSTTRSNELYNPEAKVQIYIPDSTMGRDLRGYDNGEDEVLFERNSKFTVVKSGWNNDVYEIILKERKRKRKK